LSGALGRIRYPDAMSFSSIFLRRARPFSLCAALAAFTPLAGGCSDVQVVTGAAGTAGSAGGAGGSSSSGITSSDGGAGGSGGAMVLPESAWALGAGSPDGSNEGSSIAVDAAGNIFVTGQFGGDLDLGTGKIISVPIFDHARCFLAKLDPSGKPLWLEKIPAYETTVAVDASGFPWVSGVVLESEVLGAGPTTQTVSGNFIARYTTTGELSWGATVVSSANALDHVTLVPSLDGGMYVAGEVFKPTTITYGGLDISPITPNIDVFVFAVDATGKALWGRALGEDLWSKPTGSNYYGLAGAAAPGGGLVVQAGLSTVKLDPAGKTLWTTHPTSAGPGAPLDSSRAVGVAVVSGGEIMISGHLLGGMATSFGGEPITGPAGYVVRLDPQGKPIWSTSVDLDLLGMAADPSGVVSVVGLDDALASRVDLIRISPAGAVVSKHSWSAPPGDDTTRLKTNAVAVDHVGNSLLTGRYLGTVDLGTGALPLASPGMTGTESKLFIAKIAP
jgi:hypothetical protein